MWEIEIFNFLDGPGGAVCEKKKVKFSFCFLTLLFLFVFLLFFLNGNRKRPYVCCCRMRAVEKVIY